MCGIVGYLGDEPFSSMVLDGLRLLMNRGYDSVGIASIINENLEIIKYASTYTSDSLDQLEKAVENQKEKYGKINIGIGHTRWATHGAKTSINAHPHIDNGKRIALVHNGIIENYGEMKKQLLSEGYSFQSETDTEVISVLIGKFLDKGFSVSESIEKALSHLYGTWALVIIHKDFPHSMWLARNGSPLLLGIDNECMMVASEQIAFGNHIKKYIALDNQDILQVVKKGNSIQYSKNIQDYIMNTKNQQKIDTKPIGFDHWMLKEIMEQADSVSFAMNNGGRFDGRCVKLGGFENYYHILKDCQHLVLLGCGTSFHAGLWAVPLFKDLDFFDSVSIYDGAEFSLKDLPKKGSVAVLFLSQSGETKDLHRCIELLGDRCAIKIGVVNSVDSMIARETDCGVYLNAGREVAVASTKSFTNQCIVLTLIALWFSQPSKTVLIDKKKKQMMHDLFLLPSQMCQCLQTIPLWIDSHRQILEQWSQAHTIFVLGKGPQEAIAKEGALKIKEVSYIHAEGYSSSALKHGPFALIEQGVPIFILDIGLEYHDKNKNAFQEILSREADVWVIGDSLEDFDTENRIQIEKNVTFGGLLANLYLQMISYHLALIKGYHPDFPRNLAKVVTVE